MRDLSARKITPHPPAIFYEAQLHSSFIVKESYFPAPSPTPLTQRQLANRTVCVFLVLNQLHLISSGTEKGLNERRAHPVGPGSKSGPRWQAWLRTEVAMPTRHSGKSISRRCFPQQRLAPTPQSRNNATGGVQQGPAGAPGTGAGTTGVLRGCTCEGSLVERQRGGHDTFNGRRPTENNSAISRMRMEKHVRERAQCWLYPDK